MNPLIWRAGWRQVLVQPWLTLLAIISIALGVATATAVELANQGAMRAMQLAIDSTVGAATHRISGPPKGIPETFYATWRMLPNAPPTAPIVTGLVHLPQFPDFPLTILGIDPLAEKEFRPHLEMTSRQETLHTLLTHPQGAILLAETAQKLQLKPGDPLLVEANGQTSPIILLGVMTTTNPMIRQGMGATLLMDIASAQELLGMIGYLSRIDVILQANSAPPLPLPPELQLLPAHDQMASLVNLTKAFRLNLTALSLLALLVGLFIIYNALTFSVVRRRMLIGLLRAQGVTRREIFVQILTDGLLLGVVGTLLGLGLGSLLGEMLLHLVARTVNDLYFRLYVTEVYLAPMAFFQGALLGIGVTLTAAIPPAWEAASTPVIAALSRSTLEHKQLSTAPKLAAIGGGLLLSSGALALLPTTSLPVGLVAMGLLTLGVALLAPWFTALLMQLLRTPMESHLGLIGVLATGSVQRGLSRAGAAVAALAVATAIISGMGILIESFRTSVVHWLDTTIASDIYVSVAGTLTTDNSMILDPELIKSLSQVPGIASVGLGRRINLETPGEITRLHILDIDQERFSGMRLQHDNPLTLWPLFANQEQVLITESFAFRRGLHPGDTLTLPTPSGPHGFVIAAIYTDYRSDAGLVTMSLATFANYWHDNNMGVMGIRLQEQADLPTVLAALRKQATDKHTLVMQPNRETRQASLEIFDRTFAITRALRLLALLTAFFGVLTALSAIRLERMRELASLRALGLTVGEIQHSILLQTGLLGLAAGLLALPLGLMQGLMLIHVVNYRAFGWTLETVLDPWLISQPILLAIPTALLAGAFPARQMAKTPPAEALREI